MVGDIGKRPTLLANTSGGLQPASSRPSREGTLKASTCQSSGWMGNEHVEGKWMTDGGRAAHTTAAGKQRRTKHVHE